MDLEKNPDLKGPCDVKLIGHTPAPGNGSCRIDTPISLGKVKGIFNIAGLRENIYIALHLQIIRFSSQDYGRTLWAIINGSLVNLMNFLRGAYAELCTDREYELRTNR